MGDDKTDNGSGRKPQTWRKNANLAGCATSEGLQHILQTPDKRAAVKRPFGASSVPFAWLDEPPQQLRGDDGGDNA